MAGFPESIEAVYIGRGLWFRVRVLDTPAALVGKDAIRVAVSAAVSAMEPDQVERQRDESAWTHRVAKHAKAVAGVARQAVIGHAWSDVDEAAEQAHGEEIARIHEQATEAYRRAQEGHAQAVLAAGDDVALVTSAGEALGAAVAEVDDATRTAVEALGRFAPGTPPGEWKPITIVPNPQDEDRSRNAYALATVDQIAVDWVFRVADVALRTMWEARSAARPLSPSGRP